MQSFSIYLLNTTKMIKNSEKKQITKEEERRNERGKERN